jgi:hypothetical protein
MLHKTKKTFLRQVLYLGCRKLLIIASIADLQWARINFLEYFSFFLEYFSFFFRSFFFYLDSINEKKVEVIKLYLASALAS